MPYTYDYPRPAITVDAVIFSKNKQLLLIQRNNPPFKGFWAFPGGFVDMNETLEEAVARELFEETGIQNINLKQFQAFSGINRDPRHRTISIVFTGIIEKIIETKAGDDAGNAGWFDIINIPDLAFDHNEILLNVIKSMFPKNLY